MQGGRSVKMIFKRCNRFWGMAAKVSFDNFRGYLSKVHLDLSVSNIVVEQIAFLNPKKKLSWSPKAPKVRKSFDNNGSQSS